MQLTIAVLLSFHVVNITPTATGIQLWNTIAPLIFPNASESFPFLIHITLLNFSGNSVAMGVIIKASIIGEICIKFETSSMFDTNMYDPDIIPLKAIDSCSKIAGKLTLTSKNCEW